MTKTVNSIADLSSYYFSSEEEWRHMKFDDEQPTKRLKKEFIKQCRKDGGWDKDKEIYVDFILESDSLIHVNYG